MHQSIHLVVGYSGSYDDYRSWEVCAYLSANDAEAHVARANAWVAAARARMEEGHPLAYDTDFRGVNPYDPVLAESLARFPDSGFFSGLASYRTHSVTLAASVPPADAAPWDWTAPTADRVASVVQKFQGSAPGSLRLVDLRHYLVGSLIARGLDPRAKWAGTTVHEHVLHELAYLLRPLPAHPATLKGAKFFDVYGVDAIFGTSELEEALAALDIDEAQRHELDKLEPALAARIEALREGRSYRWESDAQRAQRLACLELLASAFAEARARAEALTAAEKGAAS